MTHKCVSVRFGVYCRMLVALSIVFCSRLVERTDYLLGLVPTPGWLLMSRIIKKHLLSLSSSLSRTLRAATTNWKNKNMKWNDFNQETQLEKLKFLSVCCHRLPVSSGLGKKTGRSQFWLMMAKDILAEMRISFFFNKVHWRTKETSRNKKTNTHESSHQLQLIKSFSCW